MTEYSQGILGEGAAILKDGVPMTIEEIVEELQQKETMKAPPTKRAEAITDLIFEWIGPEGCDQRQVAERLEYILEKYEAGRMLPNYWNATVEAICTAADCRNLPDDDAVSIGVWDRTATPKNFHAIIRYNVGDFRALKEELDQPPNAPESSGDE